MEHNPLLPLGCAIKTQREKLKLTQEYLAEKTGFDRTYISMLERGRRNPSFLNLLRIAKGLEIPITKLIGVYDASEAN